MNCKVSSNVSSGANPPITTASVMPLFKYLLFKHKYKTNFKKATTKNDSCYLDAYQTMGNICRNVKLPIELIHDVYTAYYKKG